MAGEIKGSVSSLEVSTDGGTTWEKVLGRVDMNLSLTKGSVDASHMDGDGWSNYLPGRRDWSVDGTVRYIEEDEGQKALIDNYFDESDGELDIRFRLNQGVGKVEFTGKAFTADVSPSPADEAPTDMSFTLQGNGPLTKEDQAE